MTRVQFAVFAWKTITAVIEASHEDELAGIHARLMAAADEYRREAS